MHNNLPALRHPTILTKVRRAVWLAKLSAMSQAKGFAEPTDFRRHAKQHYVQNRHGRNIIRIDFNVERGMTAYGDQSRNITDMVEAALYEAKRGI